MSDLCRHLRKHLGINASNIFMYNINGRACALPRVHILKTHQTLLLKLIQLLHLNQSGVQELICDLTDAQSSAL